MSSVKRKSHFSYYKPFKRLKLFLQSGMKGFFCTCNGKEKDCIREALNLLDEHAATVCQKETVEDISQEEEIEDELKKEIDGLKNNKKQFDVVETDVKGCVFIKARVDNPIELAGSIFNEVFESKKRKSKFLIRLLPIEITCKAQIEDIKKAADRIFDNHFKCDPLTYGVIYNQRHNNSTVRMEVIEALCILVRDRNKLHVVDIKNPVKAIVVEIIKGICCLSVVPNFKKFKKYNLIELAANVAEEDANSSFSKDVNSTSNSDKNNSKTQKDKGVELQPNTTADSDDAKTHDGKGADLKSNSTAESDSKTQEDDKGAMAESDSKTQEDDKGADLKSNSTAESDSKTQEDDKGADLQLKITADSEKNDSKIQNEDLQGNSTE